VAIAGQKIDRPQYSMFSKTPVYDVDNLAVYGLLVDPVVADASDTLYTVTQAGEKRFDLISKIFYGVPDLWWVIALVNNIQDPLSGVSAGTKLRIPTKDRLAALGILN
jgi:nucleoid-associated protein YgaU